jgi:hypothetical protein
MLQPQGAIRITLKPIRGDGDLKRKGFSTSIRNPDADTIHCFGIGLSATSVKVLISLSLFRI